MEILKTFIRPSIWIRCIVAFTLFQLTKISEAMPYSDSYYKFKYYGKEGTPAENFTFYGNIAQPCEVAAVDVKFGNDSNLTTTLSSGQFYENVVKAIKKIQNKIGDVTLANKEESGYCYGISPYAFPIVHSLENLSDNDVIKKSYKYGVYLAAFWRLMELDRKIKPEITTELPFSSLSSPTPSSGFIRCGEETSNYVQELEAVSSTLEEFLCMMQSGASEKQKESFREVLEIAKKQPMFNSSPKCDRIWWRDCLALKGTLTATKIMLKGFLTLAKNKGLGLIEEVTRDDYELTEIELMTSVNEELWPGDTF